MKQMEFQIVNFILVYLNICFFLKKKADLIFKINELPNPNYKRKDSNLIYYSKIQLVDALCAESVSLV